jgi:Lhr-like helicase
VLKETDDAGVAAEVLAEELDSDKVSMMQAISEVYEQLQVGAPLPTEDHIVLEAYDRYIIVHACFGELVNKALAASLTAFSPSGKS